MRNPNKTNAFRLAIEIVVFVAVVVADAYGLVPITQDIFASFDLVNASVKRRALVGDRIRATGQFRPGNRSWRFGWRADGTVCRLYNDTVD